MFVAMYILGIIPIYHLLMKISGISRKRLAMCLARATDKFCRFDEHAEYDLPAMIDYVLQFTEEEKLVYIGNSMGTVMGFAGFSTQPKLEAKIKLFIALAPVARVGHIEGALAIMADLIYGTGTVVSWMYCTHPICIAKLLSFFSLAPL